MANNEAAVTWQEVGVGVLFVMAGLFAAMIGAPALFVAATYVIFYLLAKELIKGEAGESVGKLLLVNAFLELIKVALTVIWLSWYGAKTLPSLVRYTKYIDVLEGVMAIVAVVIAIEVLVVDAIKKLVK